MPNRTVFAIITLASLLIVCFGAVYVSKEDAARGEGNDLPKGSYDNPRKNSAVQRNDPTGKPAAKTETTAANTSKVANDGAQRSPTNQVHSNRGNSAIDPRADSDRNMDVEKSLLMQGEGARQIVDTNIARSILSSDKFAETVLSFHEKSLNDSTVFELNDVYRSAIVDQLAGISPSANLENFACSIQMCVGEISIGQDPSVWENWFKKFTEDKRTPIWTMIQKEEIDPDGNIRRRFVISIDPNINAVRIPNP